MSREPPAPIARSRIQNWTRHFFQYTIVGAIATLCDITIFILLAKQFEINHLVATAAAFLVGTGVNFVLCLKFVFRLQGHSLHVALWRKFIASLIALAANLAAMFVMVDIMAFDQLDLGAFAPLDGLLLARGIAIGLAFFINFILTKYYAFRDY